MIASFGWGGWTTSSTAHQVAAKQTDVAVTAELVPICLAREKADIASATKLGELRAFTASCEQDVAEAWASQLLETAAADSTALAMPPC